MSNVKDADSSNRTIHKGLDAKSLEHMFRRRGSNNKFRHYGTNGDWRIDNRNAKLYLYKIAYLLTEPQIIDHEEIAWGHLARRHRRGLRYDECDISYPGIVCKDCPNPYGKKYSLIDGNHRMGKMTNMNITKSPFYIIEYAMMKPHLTFKPK